MKRAVIYARYSSDNQREESADAQIRACSEYASRKSYSIVKIYTDEAETGTSTRTRDKYKDMLKDAKLDLYDIIIFHKIDRNARDEYDYYKFRNDVVSLGKSYEYATQNIDSSPEGRLMENQLVGMAAYFSRNLANEVRKGQRENALKAKHNGGKPPLGYDVDKDGHYIINEQEADAVRMIFDMKLRDTGYAAIINELRIRGIKTKLGNDYSKNSLHDILKNDKYIGVYSYNKTVGGRMLRKNTRTKSDQCIVIENALPAIVSDDVFYEVQELLKKSSYGGRYTAIEAYSLTGLIFCKCGAAMNGCRVNRKGITTRYYRCRSKQMKFDCDNKLVRADELEDRIYRIIEREILSPGHRNTLLAELNTEMQNKSNNIDMRFKDLVANKDKLEKRCRTYLEMIGDGDFMVKEIYKQTREELNQVSAELKNMKSIGKELLSYEQLELVLDSYLYNSKDPEALKSMFQVFVKKVVINNENLELYLKLKVLSFVVETSGIEPLTS